MFAVNSTHLRYITFIIFYIKKEITPSLANFIPFLQSTFL